MDSTLNAKLLCSENIVCKMAFLVQYSKYQRNKVMNAHMH